MSGYSSHKAFAGVYACTSGKDRWRVVNRNCNYSAFSGYHRTSSDYSALLCLDCGARWRTNAKYVVHLPDLTPEEKATIK